MADTERERGADDGGDLPTADLMTATTVAHLMGITAKTLIGWLDAGDPDGHAPKAIVRGHRYVFRPSVVVPWLEIKGYFVPEALAARAKRESERAA